MIEMKLLLATTPALFLCACGFMTPVKQYDGEARHLQEITVIKAHAGRPFTSEIHATISGYMYSTPSGTSQRKSFGIKGFTDYPHMVQVLAGQYEVELYCFNFPTPSVHRSVQVLARPGHTYLLKCELEDGEVTAKLASEDRSIVSGD